MNIDSLQKDYERLLEIADMWMYRAKAATELAIYLNSLHVPGSTFMEPVDLRREIESQANRLMQLHKEGKTFSKGAVKEAVPSNTP